MSSGGFTAYSNTVVIAIGTALSGGSISIGTTSVFSGSSPGTFNSVAASGGTGFYSYQWQQSADNATWSNISGATRETYTVPAIYPATYFRRMVTSGVVTEYSNTVLITISATTLVGGVISSVIPNTVNSGCSPGTISSTESASGVSGALYYQWQQSTDDEYWSNISEQTSATYTVPALYSTTYYRRMVTSGSYTAYSNTIFITVIPPTLSGGSISIGTTTVSSGNSPGEFLNSESASNGTSTYSYQWQQSADNSTWTSISGQTTATCTVPALTASTYYRRMVISGSSTAYSNTVAITVTSSGGSVTSVNNMTGAVTLGLSASASGTQRTIAITGGTGTTIDVADNDNSPTNEIQTLSINGNTLTISNGNSITIPSSISYPIGTLTLTTTGTSGPATLEGTTLNIPQYSSATGGSSQWTSNANGSIQFTGGNVGIGSSSTSRNLLVNGNIYAKEVLVSTTISAPDYVFEKDYRVLPLDELNQYLETHKHLPEIPSAKEMDSNGIELSKMNLLLLKKVEEMTLYIIQLEKRVKDLEKNDGPISGKQ